VRLAAEDTAAMGAREWREFWRARGIRELQLLLRAAWDPIGGSQPGEYDHHAMRIASLLGSRASQAAIADELGPIRDELAQSEAPAEDAAAAEKIAAWFEAATR
jgi:hypothetical protein